MTLIDIGKNRLFVAAFFSVALCSGCGVADSPQPSRKPATPPTKQLTADQVMIDCAMRVPLDAKNKPERAAMDACMREKGIN